MILVKFLSQCPYTVEWNIGLLVEPCSHVFDASNLQQRWLRADQVRYEEVKEQLRFFASQEEMVKYFHPVCFRERLSEESCEQGPSIDLRRPAHFPKELGEARLFNLEELFNRLKNGEWF